MSSRIKLLEKNELLARATTGIELLEERLTDLILRLKKLASEIGTSQGELVRADNESMYSLGLAIAEEGNIMDELAETIVGDIQINIERERKFGVDLPKISKPIMMKSENRIMLPITLSSSIDTTRNSFEKLFFLYLNYVEQVIVLQRLGREIKKTSRQILVLENLIVPMLLDSIRTIKISLAEKEREELVRLRKVKRSSKGRN